MLDVDAFSLEDNHSLSEQQHQSRRSCKPHMLRGLDSKIQCRTTDSGDPLATVVPLETKWGERSDPIFRSSWIADVKWIEM